MICYILGWDQMPGPAGGADGQGARKGLEAEAWREWRIVSFRPGSLSEASHGCFSKGETGRPAGALVGNQVGTLSGEGPPFVPSLCTVSPSSPPQTPGLGAPFLFPHPKHFPLIIKFSILEFWFLIFLEVRGE